MSSEQLNHFYRLPLTAHRSLEYYGNTNTQNYFEEQTGGGTGGEAAADDRETGRPAREIGRKFRELFCAVVFDFLYFVLSRISGLHGLPNRHGFRVFRCQKN